MTTTEELRKIKKIYGEDFMHLCRENFPTILEQKGLLLKVLTTKFAGNSRTLYDDIINNGLEADFKNSIYNLIDIKEKEKMMIKEKTPYELLDEAGYTLTECTTENQIQSFKKYYSKGETLCTFSGGRLKKCVVFWAVKKNVDDIKRENFESPKREDEYGTSVMSIQFEKEGLCIVSIKNRYNHRVNNPDATYGNDLDKIIPGLTKSFARLLAERGLKLNTSNREDFNMPYYVVANDGKYYKFSCIINNIYYCPENIIIEKGEPKKIKPPSSMLIDSFILDTKNKQISMYDKTREDSKDSFPDGLQNIEKIKITKNPNTKNQTRLIQILIKDQKEPVIIEINNDNNIIGYKNNNLQKCGDNFLAFSHNLTWVEMQNLQECGNACLYDTSITELEMQNLQKCKNNFAVNDTSLTKLYVPNLKECEDGFASFAFNLTELYAPNLEKFGEDFLANSNLLTEKMIIHKANQIKSKDIAQLDQNTNMTISEINIAHRILSNSRNLLQDKDI